jgi:hypothetical protein
MAGGATGGMTGTTTTAGGATRGGGAGGGAAGAGTTGAAAISTESNIPTDRLTQQSVAFDKRWQTILHNGVVPNTAAPLRPLRLRAGAIAALPAAPAAIQGIEVIFRPDPSLWDGRFANNGWLQELPKPLTKLTWDNAALMSPATAERLGVANEDMVTLTYRNNTVTAPVLMMPGHPAESITVHLGHGRTRAGKIGNGTGFNAYALRQSSTPNFGTGVTVAKASGKYRFALTATHHLIDLERGEKKLDSTFGRDLIRVGTFDEFRKATCRSTNTTKPVCLCIRTRSPMWSRATPTPRKANRCILMGCRRCIPRMSIRRNDTRLRKTTVRNMPGAWLST